jgi:hypothetical protein
MIATIRPSSPSTCGIRGSGSLKPVRAHSGSTPRSTPAPHDAARSSSPPQPGDEQGEYGDEREQPHRHVAQPTPRKGSVDRALRSSFS